MEASLLGALIGTGLAIVYIVVDQLGRWQFRREGPDGGKPTPETEAIYREMQERHRRIVALLDDLPSARRKRELREAMDKAVAEERFEEAIAALKELSELDGSPEERAALLATLGGLIYERGNNLLALARYAEALGHHQQALILYRELGDRLGEANALQGMGDALRLLDRYAEALGHHQQALSLYRELGDRLGEANALDSMGDALRLLARYEEALERHQQALSLYRELGDRLGEANAQREKLSEAFGLLNEAFAAFDANRYGDALNAARGALVNAQYGKLRLDEKTAPPQMYKVFAEVINRREFRRMDDAYQRVSRMLHPTSSGNLEPWAVYGVLLDIRRSVFSLQFAELDSERAKELVSQAWRADTLSKLEEAVRTSELDERDRG